MTLAAIAAAMRTTPTRLAYHCSEGSLTYGQLGRFTEGLRRYIAARVPCGRPTVIWGQKGRLMPVAMLACAFAGVPYIPIDSATPLLRLQTLLAQSDPALILAVDAFPLTDARVLPQEQLQALCNACDDLPVPDRGDGLYHLYTSGSTGTPKGVPIRRADLDCFMRWMHGLFPQPPQSILNQAAFSFDLSVADFYLAFSTGATLHAPSPDMHQDTAALYAFFADSHAELAVWTPSFAELLLADAAFGRAVLPSLAAVFLCGEVCRPSLVRALWARFPSLRIINAYGPTECTVAVSAADITPADCDRARLPVGRVRPGTTVHIMQAGEVVITGEGVSPGYLGEGTGFGEYNGQHAFFTGDLGHMEGDVLYIHGRADRQIKLHGYRVEPGEVETQLCAVEGVVRAAVVPQRTADGTVRRLVAFVQTDGTALTPQAVRAVVSQRLPRYMLPQVRIVTALPLTANGKLDYAALQKEV